MNSGGSETHCERVEGETEKISACMREKRRRKKRKEKRDEKLASSPLSNRPCVLQLKFRICRKRG